MTMSIHTAFFCVGLMFDEVSLILTIKCKSLNVRPPSKVHARQLLSNGTIMQTLPPG
jgi:hypothetical protein